MLAEGLVLRWPLARLKAAPACVGQRAGGLVSFFYTRPEAP